MPKYCQISLITIANCIFAPLVLILSLGCTNIVSKTLMTKANSLKPPVADKIPFEMNLHGVKRVDDYFWLRDDARQEPKILAHLTAENNYKDVQFAPYQPLQESLFKELVARLDKDESSVPYQWHKHWYSRRYQQGFEYPLVIRTADQRDSESNDSSPHLHQHEQVLLDVNVRAEGHDFYGLGGVSVSHDESKLAFGEDILSRRIYKLFFKDLDSGNLLDDVLDGTDGSLVWANDNQHVFYIKKDPQTLLGNQVFRHQLGTEQSKDVLVYEEQDDTYYISLGKSLDETRIVLFHESTITSEVSVLDADSPLTLFKPLLPREEGHEYSVAKLGSDYYILTNWQADNFRLMKASEDQMSDKSLWQQVIAADDDTRIEDVLLLDKYLIVQTRTKGISQIEVRPFGGQSYQLAFDDPAYVVGLDMNASQSSDKLRIYYSSPTTPESIYEYDLSQPMDRRLLKQEKILGDFDSKLYQAERLFISARDGVKVPVTLVYRKDKFAKDGANPLYQYGYGAYGHTIEPDFDSSVISLLDRGVVYAIAHVRGGEMLGRPWYDAGRMLNKQHSFDDFIDVTKALVAQGYGDNNKVVAAGGSAGGLLMGGVINQAPDLYFAVAAHVPFVDIVTTMLDETIPLTTNEYDEWGNPNEKAYFDYMLSYSPYDQISRQAYPHLLVTTGLHDSQVQYFEPAKWVAKLRDYKTDDNQLLFHIDMEAGHGGKSGRYRRYQDTAQEYAFFLGLLGLN
ncbi:S9 family peptidase [Shewanella eurypsychrophilus]|uniref:S9 family peptidase n=2 Tax=Shewanellaceae TaxID=267890 RepID=A0ABX8S300_9GAMM|nr:prolyl oligopeptidase family serine peptidase [Shewanella sp. YLB-09]QXP44949.1 S9 family peptidase [Shewanella eurypsychrophilus]